MQVLDYSTTLKICSCPIRCLASGRVLACFVMTEWKRDFFVNFTTKLNGSIVAILNPEVTDVYDDAVVFRPGDTLILTTWPQHLPFFSTDAITHSLDAGWQSIHVRVKEIVPDTIEIVPACASAICDGGHGHRSDKCYGQGIGGASTLKLGKMAFDISFYIPEIAPNTAIKLQSCSFVTYFIHQDFARSAANRDALIEDDNFFLMPHVFDLLDHYAACGVVWQVVGNGWTSTKDASEGTAKRNFQVSDIRIVKYDKPFDHVLGLRYTGPPAAVPVPQAGGSGGSGSGGAVVATAAAMVPATTTATATTTTTTSTSGSAGAGPSSAVTGTIII